MLAIILNDNHLKYANIIFIDIIFYIFNYEVNYLILFNFALNKKLAKSLFYTNLEKF